MIFLKLSQILCLLFLLSHSALFAQTKARYTFAINEGGSSQIIGKDVAARYKDLGTELSKTLKKPVDIEIALDYKILAKGLADERYDLAFIHPTQITMNALNSKKYRLIAGEKSHTDYQVYFFVMKDSPLKSLADLKRPQQLDKVLIAPMEDSVTSAIAKVMIKDTLGHTQTITYTNQEDALPFASENGAIELESVLFMIKNGLGAVAASASLAVINDWKATGGRVIANSPKVPVKHIVASARFSDSDRDKISAYFLTLDKSEAGLKTLQRIGFAGFIPVLPAKVDELIKFFTH